jgi:hypothetical protein
MKDTRGVEIDHDFTERTTFIVTADGKISAVFSTADDKVSPADHVAKSLAAVQQLKRGKSSAQISEGPRGRLTARSNSRHAHSRLIQELHRFAFGDQMSSGTLNVNPFAALGAIANRHPTSTCSILSKHEIAWDGDRRTRLIAHEMTRPHPDRIRRCQERSKASPPYLHLLLAARSHALRRVVRDIGLFCRLVPR